MRRQNEEKSRRSVLVAGCLCRPQRLSECSPATRPRERETTSGSHFQTRRRKLGFELTERLTSITAKIERAQTLERKHAH
jgi:hypothetical protein